MHITFILQVLHKWSQQSGKYQKGVCEQKWVNFDGEIEKLLTVRTLVKMANEDKPENVAKTLHYNRTIKSFPRTDTVLHSRPVVRRIVVDW